MGFRIIEESIKSNLYIKKYNFSQTLVNLAKEIVLAAPSLIRVEREEVETSKTLLEFIDAQENRI